MDDRFSNAEYLPCQLADINSVLAVGSRNDESEEKQLLSSVKINCLGYAWS